MAVVRTATADAVGDGSPEAKVVVMEVKGSLVDAGDETEAAALRTVVAAARTCFTRFGVHRTRMEDVAREAGMARSRLYRIVSSKDELVELALLARNREWADELRAMVPEAPEDIGEAIVQLMVTALRLGRGDAEFAGLAEAVPRVRLQFLLTGVGSPMHRLVAYPFEPLFERARAEGRWRDGVSEEDVVHWLAIVLSVLTPSEDIDDEALLRLLRTFVAPALLGG
jgi:AcrR family transcriptional regulator